MLYFRNECKHRCMPESCCEINGEICMEFVSDETMPCCGVCYCEDENNEEECEA